MSPGSGRAANGQISRSEAHKGVLVAVSANKANSRRWHKAPLSFKKMTLAIYFYVDNNSYYYPHNKEDIYHENDPDDFR